MLNNEETKREQQTKLKKIVKNIVKILLIGAAALLTALFAATLNIRTCRYMADVSEATTPTKQTKTAEDDQKWLDTLAGSKDIATVDHEIKEFTLQLTSKELNIEKIKELNLDIINDDFKNIYRDLRNSYAQQSLLISLAYPNYSFTVKDVEGEIMGTFYEGKVIYDAFPLVR